MNTTKHLTTLQVSVTMGYSESTIRRAIKDECKRLVPDWARFVPGGRCFASNMHVVRVIFEKVRSGELATPVEIPSEQPRQILQLHITGELVPVSSSSNANPQPSNGLQLVQKVG